MSKNDITGDRLVSKPATEAYGEGHDRIFGKKKEEVDYSLPKPPKGYTAEELDADNPYNNWMNEK